MSIITRNVFFTSESVSEGHPDKLCDLVSDAILDACLKQDPYSRVACECYVTTNHLIIGGEITTNANVDYEKVAREVILGIGYTKREYGIDGNSCKIDVLIKKQSNDIAMGVNTGGAGDQGIMFGYACDETKQYMPLAITLAHELVGLATNNRKTGIFKHARPDMKSQVTVEYIDGEIKVDTVVMSIQHDNDYNEEEFKNYVKEEVIAKVMKEYNLNHDYKVLINPTGRFIIGGPEGDVGLTGRKIIVDTYGGASRHGGGAFSGKDATKVDRSAAYMARYIAKNIVAAGFAKRCEIQLSYAIGVAKPVSVLIDTFDTAIVDEELLFNAVIELFNLEPLGIIETLDLRKPHYFNTAAYGHFGKEQLPWEKTDKIDELKKYIDNHKKV